MRSWPYSALVALVAVGLGYRACATDSTAAPPAAPSSDRLVLSGNGSTLSGASGGGGGSLTWLHDYSAGVLGIGGEYQTLANAHWAFGSLSGSVSTGGPRARWTFSGQAHFGRGDIGGFHGLRRFDYRVEGLGVAGTFGGRLTLQLSAKQFDVDTTHGTMPKVALGMLWTPHLQTTVSYSKSVSGNLGSQIETLRVDRYGPTVSWLVGGATGHVAPSIVNIYTGVTGAAPQLREGYVGLSKAFSGSDWSIVLDYLKVANERRITLTLVCTLGLGSAAT
jgi:hypothetical protein